VTIELQRACKKESLDQLVRAYHEEYPHAEMIADMVKNRISEFLVITHMSAKGSNSYIGADILSFYNALSPVLFGELGALNTRFGRSDLVQLFYTLIVLTRHVAAIADSEVRKVAATGLCFRQGCTIGLHPPCLPRAMWESRPSRASP